MEDSHQKLLAQLGAIVFVAIAVTALVLGFVGKEEQSPEPRKAEAASVNDPHRTMLRRCQRLGEAAREDDDCLAVWAASRDRFLGRTPDDGR